MLDHAGAVLVCAVEGTVLTDAEREFLGRTSGVTLFAWNVPEDHARLLDLTTSLQACRSAGAPPLVIAIDQEGGRVRRLKAPFPNAGPAMGLAGGKDDLSALNEIRAIAHDMAARLLRLGVNVDFAPCVDILTEATNTAIGDRAFGMDAKTVAKRAGAFMAGLHDAGVLGCLKHFPGQGDAKVDTHLGSAVVDLPIKQLMEREVAPFAALIEQAPMVMVAHCIYPQWAAEEASRSPRIMQGLLRRELGFGGVIVSDDMLMGAVPQDEQAWQDAIIETVAAGADMVLVCRHLERAKLAHAALKREAARHPAFAARLEDAALRMLALRQHL